MKNLIILFFVNVLFQVNTSFANNNPEPIIVEEYAISNIPEELLKDAIAVVRMDEQIFNLVSPKNATLTHKYAITILNPNADGFADFSEYYDQLDKISSIKGKIFDKYGQLVKKVKKKEIIDQSAVSSISLYEDSRIKIVDILNNDYPFTVEFEFQRKYSGLRGYPIWFPMQSYNISVQNSSYQAVIPNHLKIRHQARNFSIEPKIDTEGNHKTYFWEMKNKPAMTKEPYAPHYREIFPMVIVAPNQFEYDGYKGNMETWESYGQWVHTLTEGRDELPLESINEIKNLVKGIDQPEKKIQVIYEYLQSKTRYISIQLGIGGMQPFEAKEVDKNGYGDCKALSNYTLAMLKAVGIKSYHVSIGAGRGEPSIDPEFPSAYFTNHRILCVPLENDTIWLECTSQNDPFGFIGSFNHDRPVLLITEEGGKVVRTPTYKQSDNTQIREAKVNIDPDGNASVDVTTKYQGLQYENVQYQFLRNEKEQKEILFERLDISNIEIQNFSYAQVKDRIPEAIEKLELKIKNYASASGKRIFIPLNILNKKRKAPKKIRNRKSNVVQGLAFIDTDKITYEIPGYFKIEHLPEAVNIESDFGTYAVTVTQNDNLITYTRTIKIHKKTFPPERYKDLRAFYKKIVKADKMKLVVIQEDRP